MVTITITAEAFTSIAGTLVEGSKDDARPDGKGGYLTCCHRSELLAPPPETMRGLHHFQTLIAAEDPLYVAPMTRSTHSRSERPFCARGVRVADLPFARSGLCPPSANRAGHGRDPQGLLNVDTCRPLRAIPVVRRWRRSGRGDRPIPVEFAPGGRASAMRPGPARGADHRLVMTTTSRYSLGATIVPSSALFVRANRLIRSAVRSFCLASSRAANAFSIGP
jgi:hypothetical protein